MSAPELTPGMARTPPLGYVEEARVFWWLRRRLTRNVIQQTLERARLRLTLVVVLTVLLWLGLFVLFFGGFEFLRFAVQDTATHDQTVRAVFSTFFSSLTVMLIFSNAVLQYGMLFRSAEARFLLTTPAQSSRVFLQKFHESILLSSWGSLLLASPMLIAYGVAQQAGWCYFALLLPFLLAFVYIPCGVGAMACLVVVRWLPQHRRRVLAIVGIGLLCWLGWVAWSLISGPRSGLLTLNWFQEMLTRLRFSENRLLPSWWISSGLLTATRAGLMTGPSREILADSFMFLAVTLANGLVLHQLALELASRIYRAGYNLVEGNSPPRRVPVLYVDQLMDRLLFPLSPGMRLLLIKDFRVFRRDPMQWSQSIIFLALLFLYLGNTHRLAYDATYTGWLNVISFVNLAVVGLILSTFTTRFIFPLISLEARRFWIFAPMPLPRDTIVWSKFWFSTLGTLVPSSLLIIGSDWLLQASALVIGLHVLVCVMLSTGLSALAVGLGARMPNVQETSPAKIAAGFGGTLTLVLSAAYIGMVVSLIAVPCTLYYASSEASWASHWWIQAYYVRLYLAGGIGLSLLLAALTTVVPLRVGLKAFRAQEF